MRMKGYGSASLPQKSFKIYFRDEYGRSNIQYPIFENSSNNIYKRIILRNSGNVSIPLRFAFLEVSKEASIPKTFFDLNFK